MGAVGDGPEALGALLDSGSKKEVLALFAAAERSEKEKEELLYSVAQALTLSRMKSLEGALLNTRYYRWWERKWYIPTALRIFIAIRHYSEGTFATERAGGEVIRRLTEIHFEASMKTVKLLTNEKTKLKGLKRLFQKQSGIFKEDWAKDEKYLRKAKISVLPGLPVLCIELPRNYPRYLGKVVSCQAGVGSFFQSRYLLRVLYIRPGTKESIRVHEMSHVERGMVQGPSGTWMPGDHQILEEARAFFLAQRGRLSGLWREWIGLIYLHAFLPRLTPKEYIDKVIKGGGFYHFLTLGEMGKETRAKWRSICQAILASNHSEDEIAEILLYARSVPEAIGALEHRTSPFDHLLKRKHSPKA